MQPDLLQRNPISPTPTSAPPVQPPGSHRNVPEPAATSAYPRQPRTGCRNVPSFNATARRPLHPGLLRCNLDPPAATRSYSLQLEIVRCNLSSSAAPWPLPPQPREGCCNVRWSTATFPSRLQRPQRGGVLACYPSHRRDSLQPGPVKTGLAATCGRCWPTWSNAWSSIATRKHPCPPGSPSSRATGDSRGRVGEGASEPGGLPGSRRGRAEGEIQLVRESRAFHEALYTRKPPPGEGTGVRAGWHGYTPF
jgi:hypothetical protein